MVRVTTVGVGDDLVTAKDVSAIAGEVERKMAEAVELNARLAVSDTSLLRFKKIKSRRVCSGILTVVVNHELIIVAWEVIGRWDPSIRAIIRRRIFVIFSSSCSCRSYHHRRAVRTALTFGDRNF